MTSTFAPMTSSNQTSLHPQKKFQVGVIMPLNKDNSDLFLKTLEAMNEWNFHIMALAEGDIEVQKKCFDFVKQYKNFEFLENTTQNKERILEKSDVLFFPGNPNKKCLQQVLQKGVVPVLPEGNQLKNFNPQNESGESFTFQESNFWSMISALSRAFENHKFPYDWKNIQQNLKMMTL
jgi:hypothetical protein